MNQTTYYLCSSSCIYLIFTNQLSLNVNSEINPSLHANWHYQMTYCKLNLKIKYPLPYPHLVWNFKETNTISIIKVIHIMNCRFCSIIKVYIGVYFKNTWINIFSDFSPTKYVIVDDKNPLWMAGKMKNKIVQKTIFISHTLKIAKLLLTTWSHAVSY